MVNVTTLEKQNIILSKALSKLDTNTNIHFEKEVNFSNEENHKYIEALVYIKTYMDNHKAMKPSMDKIRDVVFSYTGDDKKYMESCEHYDEKMSYEEYVTNIYRCLRLSSWHYKPESAIRIITDEDDVIREFFEQKESIISAMVEVGFGCG